MKKIILMQVLTENGVTKYNGLFDKNGLPVTAELEKEDDGVVLTIMHKELTEEEKQIICDEYDNCNECTLFDDCEVEYESDSESERTGVCSI